MSAIRCYWLRVIAWFFVVGLVSVSLFGCGRTSTGNGDDDDIRDFKLSDGTRCVIYRFRGGITCDWKQQ